MTDVPDPTGTAPPTVAATADLAPTAPLPQVGAHVAVDRELVANALEELLLGGPRRYTRLDVLRLTGQSEERTRRIWRALGFSDVDDDAVAFTEADVTALRGVTALLDQGVVDEERAVSLARATGQSLSRLAEWQATALSEMVAERAGPPRPNASRADDVMRQVAMLAETLVPALEPLQTYAWRRFLASTASRAVAGNPQGVTARVLAVGFADLVGFTSLSRELPDDRLSALVDRFETGAADIITMNDGRIVKTLGDEVLYVADTVADGAEIALGLAESSAGDPLLPDVRVGMAYGTVLTRFGDVYGTTVNAAARLTSRARPNTVYLDPSAAKQLRGDPAYRVRPRRRRLALQGLGAVEASVLSRADQHGADQR